MRPVPIDPRRIDAAGRLSSPRRMRLDLGRLWGRLGRVSDSARPVIPARQDGDEGCPEGEAASILLAAALADTPLEESSILRLHHERGLGFEAIGNSWGSTRDSFGPAGLAA